MALVGEIQQLRLKNIGDNVNIPNNYTAKLMYYLNCVFSVLEVPNEDLHIFTSYNSYMSVSNVQQQVIILLCTEFSPDKLINFGIFNLIDDDFSSTSKNNFYEISNTTTSIAAFQNLIIGDYNCKALRIMLFNKAWLEQFYLNPLKILTDESSIRESHYQRLEYNQTNYGANRSTCCSIL